MNLDRFRQLPLMGILRGGDVDLMARLVETVVEAGLETLEIAMNTPNAVGMIARGVEVSAGRLAIGAGTVTTPKRLDAALGAGATFVVMPTLVGDVVATCRARSVPVFPGALSPQEIFAAWQAGATMVKVFPASLFGPAYFREVKGPFEDIELLACGGVNAENMASYFDCGASAVAFGGSVFGESHLRAGEFEPIGAAVRGLVAA
ncbi:MAG: bifunctional 4-hydroxy-2-oxoglutarate aldolase/2-dehydro-3-deoxy-phosphogluconate aldolase, partial [Myxococcales bacterium]